MKFKPVGLLLLLVLLVIVSVLAVKSFPTSRVDPSLSTLVMPIPQTVLDVPNPPDTFEKASLSKQPTIRWEEFANRRFRLSGVLPSARDSERLARAVEAKLMKEETLENRIQILLDSREALWIDEALTLDYGKFLNVRDVVITFTSETLAVTGRVESEDEESRIEGYVDTMADAAGLVAEVDLEVGALSSPILSIWQGADKTVLVQGEVAEGTRKSTLALVKENLPPGARLVDDISESRFVKSPQWMDDLEEMLPSFLREIQDFHFLIEGPRVEVSGIALAESIPRLRELVSTHFPESRYEVTADIVVGTPIAAATEENPNARPRAATVAEWVRNTKIYFESKDILKSEEKSKLNQLATLWFSENHQSKLLVYGFTDSTGDASTNSYFRKQRAQVVVNYLVDLGISRQLLVVEETPEEVLIAAEEVAENLGELRRVEFRIEGGDIRKELVATVSIPPLEVVEFEDVLKETKIFFGVSDFSLSSDDKLNLERFAAVMLAENIDKPIAIYGYADSRGSAEANKWITEERTGAVKNFLVSQGIPEEMLDERPVRTAKVIEETENSEEIDREARDKADRDARRVEFGFVEDETDEEEEPSEAPEDEASEESPEETPAEPSDVEESGEEGFLPLSDSEP